MNRAITNTILRGLLACVGLFGVLPIAGDGARLMVQVGHPTDVLAALWSGDGRLALTRGDGRIKLWNADLRLLADLADPCPPASYDVKPAQREGLISASGRFVGANCKVFDRTSGAWYGFRGMVSISSAADEFAVADGQKISVYAEPSKFRHEISAGCKISTLKYTRSGEIIGHCNDSNLQIWNGVGEPLGATPLPWKPDVFATSFDGQNILLARKVMRSSFIFFSKEMTELHYRGRNGNTITEMELEGGITSLAPRNDGGFTIGTTGWIFQLDTSLKVTGKIRGHFRESNGVDLSAALDVNPATGDVISASGIGAKLYDKNLSLKVHLPTMLQFNNGLAFSRDGTRLVSGGRHEAALWTGGENMVLPLRAPGIYTAEDADISPQGHVALAWLSGHVAVWNADGTPLSVTKAHLGGASKVSFDDQGSTLVTIGSDREKKTWDYNMNLLSTEPFEDYQSPAARTSKNFQFHAFLDQLRAKKARGLASLENEGVLLSAYDFQRAPWQTKDIALHPQGHIIAKFDTDMVVRLWSTDTGELLGSLVHIPQVGSAIIANDGRFQTQGAIDAQMHWVAGDEVIALSEFRQKYEHRDLLKALLSGEQKPIEPQKQQIPVSRRLIGKVFQIKSNGDVVIYTKVSGSLRAGKKLKVLNGANYVDATISNTLHTNVTAKAKGAVAVGNPVFE